MPEIDVFGPKLLELAADASSVLWIVIGLTALVMVIIMLGRLFPKREY